MDAAPLRDTQLVQLKHDVVIVSDETGPNMLN